MTMLPVLAFGLPNGSEMLLIFLVVLLLFGSKKLPELARGLGKSMHEFRKAKDEFESELHSAKTEMTVNEPPQRQLAQNTAAVNSLALEQQVRELQEQLREMNQKNATSSSAPVTVDPVAAAKPVVAAVPVEIVPTTTGTPSSNHPGQVG